MTHAPKNSRKGRSLSGADFGPLEMIEDIPSDEEEMLDESRSFSMNDIGGSFNNRSTGTPESTSEQPSTGDFLLFLGTGTSCGVPKMSCVSTNAKLRRENKVPSVSKLMHPMLWKPTSPALYLEERGSCPSLFNSSDVENKYTGPGCASSSSEAEEEDDDIMATFCHVCEDARDARSKNRRRNTSILIHYKNKNIVIDCGKTFYDAAVQWFPEHGIHRIDAIILTHDHTDATGGLDDVRDFTMSQNESIPVFLNQRTMDHLSMTHFYLVNPKKASGLCLAALEFKTLPNDTETFQVLEDFCISPIEVFHGPQYLCWGFKFGEVVYLSDVSAIPPQQYEKIKGCKLLVLDAQQWDGPLRCHLTIRKAIEEIKKIQPEKTLLVDMNHMLDHEYTNMFLKMKYPEFRVQLAFDGQIISDVRLQ